MKIKAHISPTLLAAVVMVVGFGVFPRAARALTGSKVTITANGQNSITYGTSVMFTAVVASINGTGHPSGTVTLKSNGVLLETLTIASDGPGSASARASWSTQGPDLVAGMDVISADYSGDANFQSSSGSRTETVSENPSFITSLTADPNPSGPMDPVTFTASISAGGNHVTGLGLMTGTVEFSDEDGPIGTSSSFVADPVLAVYTASFVKDPALLPGIHDIRAIYSGDANNLTSPDMTTGWMQTVLALTNLAITGPAMVAEGNTGTYTATGTWSDGSMAVLAATFSVSPAAGVSITPGGLLTALISAPPGAVTVTASYTADGVTKMATKTVTITPTLVSLDIGGRGEVTGPGAATYTATATFGDGTTSVVTPVWSIAPGVFATIGADGSLTAILVTAKQLESINASYTFDGVTELATKVVSIVPEVSTTTTTRVSTTTMRVSTTTTTLPGCTTLPCIIDAARYGPSCSNETLPASIANKLALAITQAELAASQAPKKAKRLYRSVRRLLTKAEKATTKAAGGRRPTLSKACASALVDALRAGSALVGSPP